MGVKTRKSGKIYFMPGKYKVEISKPGTDKVATEFEVKALEKKKRGEAKKEEQD